MPALQADLELLIDEALSNIEQLDRALVDVSSNFSDDISKAFDDLLNGGVIDSLRSELGTVGSDLGDNLQSAIDDVSVAQLRDELDSVGAGIADSIGLGFEAADDSVNAFVSRASDELSTVGTGFGDELEASISKAEVAVSSLGDGLQEIALSFGDALSEAFDNLDTTALSGVQDSVEQLGEATRSTGSSVGELATGINVLETGTGLLEAANAGAEGSARGLASGLGTIAGVSTRVVGGVAAVTGSLALLTHAGLQTVSAQQQLDLAFGDFAKSVQRVNIGGISGQLGELANKAGSSSTNIELATAKLGQLAQASGLSQEAAAESAASFQALALRAVALNPALGDAGDVMTRLTTVLARGGRAAASLNIQLTPAEITVRALADTGKTAAKDLTTFERAAAGAAITVEKLGGKLGTDFEKGSKQAAVQFKSLKVTIEDTIATLGTPLVAPVLKLAQAFKPLAVALGELLAALAGGLVPALSILGDVLGALAPAVQFFAQVLTSLQPIITPLVLAFIALKTAAAIGGVIESAGVALLSFAGQAATANIAIPGLATGLRGLATGSLFAGEGIVGLAGTLGGVLVPVALAAAAIGGIAFALGAFDDNTSQVSEELRVVKGDMKAVADDARTLEAAIFANVTTFAQLSEALNGAATSVGHFAFTNTASAFVTKNQIDDLKKLGLTAGDLGTLLTKGKEGFAQFFDVLASKRAISNDVTLGIAKIVTQNDLVSVSAKQLAKDLDQGLTPSFNRTGSSAVSNRTALSQARDMIEKLGVSGKITGADLVEMTQAQRNQVIATLDQDKSNADLLSTFQRFSAATAEAEKAEFRRVESSGELSKTLADAAIKQATLADGTVDYARAAEIATGFTKGFGIALGAAGVNAAVTVRQLGDLETSLDNASKSLPSLGSALDKALTPNLSVFGILPAGIDAITASLADQTKQVGDFFNNVDAVLHQGNTGLAQALLDLGPDNLGARTLAALASNQPLVAQGWENALQGLTRGKIVIDQTIAVMKARIALLSKTLLDPIAQQTAKGLFGTTDLGKLTDDQLAVLTAHLKNGTGPAAKAADEFFGVLEQRAITVGGFFGLSAREAVDKFLTTIANSDPGAAGEGFGLHFGTGFGGGVNQSEGLISKAARRIGEIMEDEMPDAVIGQRHGVHFGDGFGDGITDAEADVKRKGDHFREVVEDLLPSDKIARTHGLHFGENFGSGLTDAEEAAKKKAQHFVELMEDQLPDAVIGRTHGLHFIEGFGAGVTESIPIAQEGVSAVREAGIAELPTHEQGRARGVDFVQGFAGGTASQRQAVTDAINQMLGTSFAVIDVAALKFFAAGANSAGAYAAGLLSGRKGITDASDIIAAAGLNSFARVLGLNSPSTVFIKFGEETGEGFAIGLTNSIGKFVTPASESLASAAIRPIGALPTFGATPTGVPLPATATAVPAGASVHIETLTVQTRAQDQVGAGAETARELAAEMFRIGA